MLSATRAARIKWLFNHPVWSYTSEDGPEGCWRDCVSIDPTFVNPLTGEIDDDDTKNVDLQVWVEAGPWVNLQEHSPDAVPPEGWNRYNRWGSSHDYNLDCGGESVEEALLKLADLVDLHYTADGKAR